MDVWKSLKKHPAMLIGVGFAIIAVLYIVYKSNSGNSTAAQNAAANTPGGTASQLGGYIMFEEEVMNPPNVNVTVGNTTVKTDRDAHKKVHRSHHPSHPGPKDKDQQQDRREAWKNRHIIPGIPHHPIVSPHQEWQNRRIIPYVPHHPLTIKSPVSLPTPHVHQSVVRKGPLPPVRGR